MLWHNSKALIQNHAVWSYVIKILRYLGNDKKKWEFIISIPEMFVRIWYTDVKNHWQGKNCTAAPKDSDKFDYTPFKQTCPKII